MVSRRQTTGTIDEWLNEIKVITMRICRTTCSTLGNVIRKTETCGDRSRAKWNSASLNLMRSIHAWGVEMMPFTPAKK
jgi:hypothetical protein